ncbi:hypothetical protein Pmani_035704 [Petrolisthes manimaculis]|uniref:Uncharacterized protein n=1 Tax=Petrolisthes manimaculis TaxID=1843537 RepID=A0AAE1TQ72_9EUCA|nr:hypothetical protein Pmani_035704 [Petrolisthes manimaculis]
MARGGKEKLVRSWTALERKEERRRGMERGRRKRWVICIPVCQYNKATPSPNTHTQPTINKTAMYTRGKGGQTNTIPASEVPALWPTLDHASGSVDTLGRWDVNTGVERFIASPSRPTSPVPQFPSPSIARLPQSLPSATLFNFD